jgi:2-oxoisovalerate dehydrogenase E2 component (dihydrolipoyl transacylase)
VEARNVITVSYGCDHRVIDGATVGRFSNEWKKIIENPYLALVEMS